jgi:long-subunit acyl-CoA synthetase (AMP-forming)
MHSTVHATFAATASRTPDADFLFTEAVTARTYGIAPGVTTWGQAAAQVGRLRAAYALAGYGHGHRVGLLLENRPDFLLHWFALNALGVSVVPINADMRSAELVYLAAPTICALRRRKPVSLSTRCWRTARSRLRAARRRALAYQSASTPSARCSIHPAPPAGPKAAC